MVYSHRAYEDSIAQFKKTNHCETIPDWNAERTASPEEMVLIIQSMREVQSIMTNYVGIVRSNLRLKRAFDRLLILHYETESLYERTTVSPELCQS